MSKFIKETKAIKITDKGPDMTVIESDSDFETKGLNDLDIDVVDAMDDIRPSPFWKKSWLEVFGILILWAVVVYINE